ncbi:Similar to PRPF19: Pre-mRNA-processing factor 19 (Homo sapiens) [Cotesia congregata]|uniref:Pre-mRNA-processing factor 19 n=1 Tax=Cotesia congregata TaxID=51543 RepID=A0A8J2HRE3_COTCN|nr:Similar to PRPF19: Pre-mRNA-processing factor 19 (Homo sapiens) [Cotesia congregata]
MSLSCSTSPVVKPKPPSATSIPAILKILQDEWDAVMLNSFTVRGQLQTARQELSHALYQHDAACRVISRLTKEVTAAREALASLKPPSGITQATAIPQPAIAVEAGGIAAQPVEQAGITEDIIHILQEKATVLTQERKRRGRSIPEDLLPAERIREFQTIASHPSLHSASVPGILALDIHASDTSKILTGGADKNATVFNKDTEQVVAILKGHTKKVTKVVYHPEEDVVMTASPDTTIRIWNVGTSQTTLLLRAHDASVTGLSLHPTEQSNVANFPGHVGEITSITFSENGYYLATSAEDSCVKLWDLRKLKNFKTLQLDDGYDVKDLAFDKTGTYLAVSGTDVRVYLCKQWQELKVFNDHTAAATGVRFGKNAQYIASTSMDRTLKLYGLS